MRDAGLLKRKCIAIYAKGALPFLAQGGKLCLERLPPPAEFVDVAHEKILLLSGYTRSRVEVTAQRPYRVDAVGPASFKEPGVSASDQRIETVAGQSLRDAECDRVFRVDGSQRVGDVDEAQRRFGHTEVRH